MQLLKMTPDEALKVLLSGTGIERETFRDKLPTFDKRNFLGPLMKSVLEKLKVQYHLEYAAESEGEQERHARAWLLTALGWLVEILKDDSELHHDIQAATNLLTLSAKATTLDDPTRYWALEALVRINTAELVTISQDLVKQPGFSGKDAKEGKGIMNERVRYLAYAVLADRLKEKTAIEALQGKLASEDCFAARRAIRVIPVKEIIKQFCDWLEKGDHSDDQTADAMQALASLTKEHPYKENAIEALMAFVKQKRDHSWWDCLRAKALVGLRTLEAKEAQNLMEEEVASPNAVVMAAAASGLEALVGTEDATLRVAKAAMTHPYIEAVRYGNALRYMDRLKVAETLDRLIANGNEDQQDVARALLSELGGAAALDKLRNRTLMMQHHLEAMEKAEVGIRDMFDSTIAEARKGHEWATIMNFVVFAIGIAFMGLCFSLVLDGKADITSLVTGGTGALAILYNLFLANPREKIRESVEHLMTLKIVFLGYLRQLHQTDKAFARRFVDEKPIETSEVEAYSKIIGNTMGAAIKDLSGKIVTADANG